MIATSEPIYIALTGIVPPLIKCGNVSNWHGLWIAITAQNIMRKALFCTLSIIETNISDMGSLTSSLDIYHL